MWWWLCNLGYNNLGGIGCDDGGDDVDVDDVYSKIDVHLYMNII